MMQGCVKTPYLELKILYDFLDELPPFRRLLVLQPPPICHLSAESAPPRLLPVHSMCQRPRAYLLRPQVDLRLC